MATAAEISAAVSSIYEAAVEFERWPRTLLQISDLLGGTMAALVKGDRATGAVSTLAVRSYAGAREEYATHYHAHNIAWQRMVHVPPGASVVDRELFPREAVRRNACYGEFLKRLDVHSLLTAIMVKERSFSAVATFGRSERAGEWDSGHCEIMHLLAPHLRLAAGIGQRFAGIGRNCESAALNALPEGVIILDGESRVIFANRVAEALLTAGDGISLRHAKLCASPLAVETAWFLAHSPAAILFVSDPEQSRCVALPEQLRALFGLTRTEALVAAEIFRGEGLQAAADALGIGVTTARTHLQRIFGKTGTRKQAELVRIIARTCPNLHS